ncbi:MAG TPA: ABC transporter permease, partial [Gammaproteobacteria bacterium]
DNTTLSGSQVVNALRKFSDKEEFGIQIVTGKNPAGQWYGKVINTGVPIDSVTYGSVVGEAPGQLSHALDEANINYVNPSGKFRAQLVHDSSNVIRGIVFRQQ